MRRNSINKILVSLRVRIAEICEQENPFKGEIEVDKSFFGARKRGLSNCSRATLQAIIKGEVDIDSIIHSDKWSGYNGLVHLGYKKHYRPDHGKDEFVRGKSHINGIERFWAYTKTRLSKFKGMHKNTFYLHLKETEFRYN